MASLAILTCLLGNHTHRTVGACDLDGRESLMCARFAITSYARGAGDSHVAAAIRINIETYVVHFFPFVVHLVRGTV